MSQLWPCRKQKLQYQKLLLISPSTVSFSAQALSMRPCRSPFNSIKIKSTQCPAQPTSFISLLPLCRKWLLPQYSRTKESSFSDLVRPLFLPFSFLLFACCGGSVRPYGMWGRHLSAFAVVHWCWCVLPNHSGSNLSPPFCFVMSALCGFALKGSFAPPTERFRCFMPPPNPSPSHGIVIAQRTSPSWPAYLERTQCIRGPSRVV